MVGRRDKYSGNILLYDYLYKKRAPIFLNRNLNRAFRVHQHILTQKDLQDYPEPDHDLRSVWRPPTWDQLDDMIETAKSNGSFVLEVHGVKGLERPQTNGLLSEDATRARKSRVLLRIKCPIQVSIFPQASDLPCSSSSQDAVLQADDRDSGGEVSIATDPIIIGPDTFSESGISGQSYKMAFSISFISGDEAEDFYRVLGFGDISVAPTRLSTVYGNILQCPPGRIVLHLTDQTKMLRFGLEVSMYWANVAGKSILSRWNHELKNSELHPRSYPTPPLDMALPTQYRLSFVYGNETIYKSGLVCPHDGCRRRRTKDILDLRMHLYSWHDHFSYQAKKERVDQEGVEHWKFESEVADHKADQRASDRTDEPFDVRVIAPEQPFDRRKHLDGDDEFHKSARLEKYGKHITSKAKPVAPSPTPLRRKPPDEVLARPRKTKKTYRVPKAPPGITFFRSVTKQPLRMGDEISESDDELDVGWLQLRKNAEIDKEPISEAMKRFLKVFDPFLQEENLQSDFHAGDAVVRFVREKGSWIWQQMLFGELTKKLGELLEDDVISNEVHTACLDVVRMSEGNIQESAELSERLAGLDVDSQNTTACLAEHKVKGNVKTKKDRKGKGKAEITDTGHLTPITADSDGDLEMREAALVDVHQSSADARLPYDECYCGEDALSSQGLSPVIICREIDCIRRHFHTRCVQTRTKRPLGPVNRRKRDWTCDDCTYASVTGR